MFLVIDYAGNLRCKRSSFDARLKVGKNDIKAEATTDILIIPLGFQSVSQSVGHLTSAQTEDVR